MPVLPESNRSAYVMSAILRFNVKSRHCITLCHTESNANKDIPLQSFEQILSQQKIQKENIGIGNVYYAPAKFQWRTKPVQLISSKYPSFPLFPFNCERKDGEYFNSFLTHIYLTHWRRQYFFNQNKNLSPMHIVLQHMQILKDLYVEYYEKQKTKASKHDLFTITDLILNVKLSLKNFETTEFFKKSRERQMDKNLIVNNFLTNIDNEKTIRYFFESCHPTDFFETLNALHQMNLVCHSLYHLTDLISMYNMKSDDEGMSLIWLRFEMNTICKKFLTKHIELNYTSHLGNNINILNATNRDFDDFVLYILNHLQTELQENFETIYVMYRLHHEISACTFLNKTFICNIVQELEYEVQNYRLKTSGPIDIISSLLKALSTQDIRGIVNVCCNALTDGVICPTYYNDNTLLSLHRLFGFLQHEQKCTNELESGFMTFDEIDPLNSVLHLSLQNFSKNDTKYSDEYVDSSES